MLQKLDVQLVTLQLRYTHVQLHIHTFTYVRDCVRTCHCRVGRWVLECGSSSRCSNRLNSAPVVISVFYHNRVEFSEYLIKVVLPVAQF